MGIDAFNVNQRWAGVLVEELVRQGVDTAFVAPGSRSTPLTMAVAAHPQMRTVVHFDERGTAFAALGYGRVRRKPSVWITTSGTAVANGMPAVVEAATDGVPLLLLTADRPPELRATGANQTIDQVKLFGGYVQWFQDLPAPAPSTDVALGLTAIGQAVQRSLVPAPGPVHLNCMFREPLAPLAEPTPLPPLSASVHRWLAQRRAFTQYAGGVPRCAEHEVANLAERLQGASQGLIVAGRLPTPAHGHAALALGERLGWPVLPDIGSHVRLGRHPKATTRVAYFDHMLASPAFCKAHRPEVVLQFGRRATSKRLLHFLQAQSPQHHIVVDDLPQRLDPTHQVTLRVEADPLGTCQALIERAAQRPDSATWTESWLDADQRIQDALESHWQAQAHLTEPLVARSVSEMVHAGQGLVLSSSMPIRDMDQFAKADGKAPLILANRGASGIDGIMATAAGAAIGLRGPVTVLIGDLALLHDLNSLALVRDLPITIVAVNNDGGGIFSFLPIAQQADVFEPFFGTPHGLTFESAAEQFGLGYDRPKTKEDLKASLAQAAASDRPCIVEVVTQRAQNHAEHEALLEMTRQALQTEVS